MASALKIFQNGEAERREGIVEGGEAPEKVGPRTLNEGLVLQCLESVPGRKRE
jgi:hypothetical protein